MVLNVFIKSLIMKTILYLIFALLLNCSLNLTKAAGQVSATGHITAELTETKNCYTTQKFFT